MTHSFLLPVFGAPKMLGNSKEKAFMATPDLLGTRAAARLWVIAGLVVKPHATAREEIRTIAVFMGVILPQNDDLEGERTKTRNTGLRTKVWIFRFPLDRTVGSIQKIGLIFFCLGRRNKVFGPTGRIAML